MVTLDDRTEKALDDEDRGSQYLENLRSPAAMECRDKSSHSLRRHTCLELTLYGTSPSRRLAASCASCDVLSPLRLAPGFLVVDQAGRETKATATVPQAGRQTRPKRNSSATRTTYSAPRWQPTRHSRVVTRTTVPERSSKWTIPNYHIVR